jgi:hypothetical protein
MTGVTAISHESKSELTIQPEKNTVLEGMR